MYSYHNDYHSTPGSNFNSTPRYGISSTGSTSFFSYDSYSGSISEDSAEESNISLQEICPFNRYQSTHYFQTSGSIFSTSSCFKL
ncbi:hypothetical protein TVAG_148030 [Trichomonas vaginalis G3]|uniref:Uncharacterized protein n=1 Tax=Trichomonas vaginalis (strain ATCC PRA-98 / G3) TaxID=412133 RepID=A2FQW1_TRIV3|nr:hypothetical protein TVAGG3_0959560 [Trichomonas vaginalis G3]EAX92700.1 hypothetical protein TVAG_148030 [Trichomonas vaginalis G3]KAI5487800.1 hypothetical protein TVAGG3_0959560 [Trichomonas vaginalis G3]|eukprot:XP_001305630.1 hypothetical protein [Trichomonas vaginalis G3]